MTMYDCLAQRTILALTFLVAVAMASTDMTNFFPSINGNLTKITWAHAVNNFSYLIDTLSNENIMMIEADVVLGQVDGTGLAVPIMAHPPADKSDLSLLTFFLEVKKFNSDEANSKKKGVKLDFKSIDAFLASTDIVEMNDKGKFPIWINADIISGPVDAKTVPVDADKFLDGSKPFPNSTLSIGWTTLYGSNYTGAYDANQIQKMTDAIKKNNVTQDITFPVRAGLAAESIDLLTDLVKNVDNSTLTIWSSEGDKVDVDHLRNLIAKVTISKVYVDVPNDLLEKLYLDNLPNSATKTFLNIVGIVMLVLLTFMTFG